MHIDNSQLLQSMREAAFEEAKAKLKSVTCFSYPDWDDKDRRKRQERYIELMEEFIKTVEDEGLIEGT